MEDVYKKENYTTPPGQLTSDEQKVHLYKDHGAFLHAQVYAFIQLVVNQNLVAASDDMDTEIFNQASEFLHET